MIWIAAILFAVHLASGLHTHRGHGYARVNSGLVRADPGAWRFRISHRP
jgi:hypothetical protein